MILIILKISYYYLYLLIYKWWDKLLVEVKDIDHIYNYLNKKEILIYTY